MICLLIGLVVSFTHYLNNQPEGIWQWVMFLGILLSFFSYQVRDYFQPS